MQRVSRISWNFELRSAVADTFDRYIQLPGENEAGGILLGEIYPDQNLIRVVEATVPTRADRATATTWHRDTDSANKHIHRAWRDSDGRVQYIGEWHTHAQRHPRPSGRDRQTRNELVREPGLVTDWLLLAIIGQRSNYFSKWTTASEERINFQELS